MRKRYIKIASIVLAVLAAGSFCFVYKKYYVEAQATGPSTGSTSVTTSTDAGRWKEDPEVTAVGKAGARAREVLNWALSIKDAGFTAGGSSTLQQVWSKVRDIMGVFYFLIIIIIGFGLIAKQEWAERTRRSLPALIIAFIAAYFSYFIEANVIRFTDEQIQQRFYAIHKDSGTLEERHLRAQDLLTVSFNYQEFKGYRKQGAAYGEAVANHLLLVKITTFTNYVIAFIILLRVIILWGLVIFSPFMFPFFVFPLTKKVATVWVREFFRWLLLGPLFAFFLTAVPYIWNKTNISVKDVYTGQKATNSGIPLEIQKDILNPSSSGEKTSGNVYESGTNIILSPPGNKNPDIQKDDNISSGNNLSETDTYSRWIVALLMIWGAIILPFMLLRIVMGFSVEIGKDIYNVFGNSQAAQYINNWKKVVAPPPPSPSGGPGGIIREKLVEKIPTIAPTKQIYDRPERVSTFNEKNIEKLSVPTILNVAGLKQDVPELYKLATVAENQDERKISDLAAIEQQSTRSDVLQKAIGNIAEPQKIEDQQEQDKFNKVREGVLMRSVAGDKSAQAMKNAISSNISSYLVSDIKNELTDNMAEKFGRSVAQISSETTNQNEIQQLQSIYKVGEAKNMEAVIRSLAQNNDSRAKNALPAVEKIKQAQQLPESARVPALQKISVNISHPELISDAIEKQEYTALKEIVNQGAGAGVTSLQSLLESSDGFSSLGLEGMQIVGGQIKDLSAALSELSNNAAADPRFQNRAQGLKELEAAITSALSGGDEGIKKAAKIASNINNPEQEQNQAEKQKFQDAAGIIKDTAQAGIVGAKTVESVLNEISADLELDSSGNPAVSSITGLRKAVEKDRDFIATKETWSNHYMNAPTEMGKDRKQWLAEEIKEIEESLNNFLSNDSSKKQAALQNIQKILPLALMGNYQASEIAKYLLAKLDSAKGVLTKITQTSKSTDANAELVDIHQKKVDQQQNTMTMEEEDEDKK